MSIFGNRLCSSVHFLNSTLDILRLKVLALIKQVHYVLRAYSFVHGTHIYCMGIVSFAHQKRSEEI